MGGWDAPADEPLRPVSAPPARRRARPTLRSVRHRVSSFMNDPARGEPTMGKTGQEQEY